MTGGVVNSNAKIELLDHHQRKDVIMPTTYTHYAYGQEVLRRLPKKQQRIILAHEDYYNIGVHGPDILFYYRAFSKNEVNQCGVRVHHEPMHIFLRQAFSVFDNQRRKQEAFAYLAGFMTHFMLDSSCHPYIRKRIRETGISHTEIERDWDSVMMQRDHLNPLTHRPACHIKSRPGYGKLIAPYYGLTPGKIQKSLIYMKLILNHIFRSSFGFTGRIASIINQLFLKKMDFQHYFAKRNINPGNVETITKLDSLYEESLEECAAVIVEMYGALQSGDRSFCGKKRFEEHFS